MLRIYNTLTRKVEDFKPLEVGRVKIYFCGMTVQDEPHIGHARSFIAVDVLVRLLKYLGFKVLFIRNITDIDDKIIAKAQRENVSTPIIAERYIRAFLEVSKAIKLTPPDIEPRATCHITDIIELIESLINKGFAYVTPNGDVYFDVQKFKDYGKLSHQKIGSLQAGARIEPGEFKKNPLDFALWKASKPGEPGWPSPWGKGRPGWHIECSAMSMKYLGETFDIHGGGMDLIFPHHENEIAQSEAATGKPFARYWMHVGLVNLRGDKMSKSVGNIVKVRELLELYDAETIRYWAVSTHYRKPIDFDFEAMDAAERALDRLYKRVFELENRTGSSNENIRVKVSEFVSDLESEFIKALKDDLNTPKALAILHEKAKFVDENLDKFGEVEGKEIASAYRRLGSILGILEQDRERRIFEKRIRNRDVTSIVTGEGLVSKLERSRELIDLIVHVRSRLREMKKYELADYIRSELKKLGVVLEDTKEGTIWKVVN